MKQHISALMDGELFDEEAETVVDRLKRDPDAQDEWLVYHLIGDVLRQPDHVHVDISRAVRERLQDEPTVLAPRSNAMHRARWFAISAAASVMALTVVAWLSAKVVPQAAPQPMAVLHDSGNMRPASLQTSPQSMQARSSVNDYLMAHQEYSPSNNVQGAASYIHTVAGQ